MRIDFVDAGKAFLLGFTCIGSIIGLTEVLSKLEEKYNKWKKEEKHEKTNRSNTNNGITVYHTSTGKNRIQRNRITGESSRSRSGKSRDVW